MKFTIDVDCTPQEARMFLGLPDVSALHETMLEEYEQRLRGAMSKMDPQAMMALMSSGLSPDFPGFKGFDEMQKSFWSQVMGMAANSQKQADE